MRNKEVKYEVKITWDPRDTVFIARVTELPGCNAHGSTRIEAIKNISEAIDSYIESLKEDGESIPVPLAEQNFSGKLNLRLGSALHREIAIMANEAGKSINDLLVEAAKNILTLKRRSRSIKRAI